MTRSRRRALAPRTTRARAALAAVTLAAAVGLASCGTVPPEPSASGTTSPDSAGGAKGAWPRHTSTTPESPASPTTPAAGTPSADSWVGTFQGHQVSVPRGHGATVSFTFDDGPSPRFTPQVLALLEQHQVQAVFCLIGNQARDYPSLVRREVAAGHELCDHSRDHDELMTRKGQAYVDAEVGEGLAEVTQAAPPGTPVRFYRQPGGTWSPKVVKAMAAHQLDPLRWSDDPRDWSRPGSSVIVHRVVAGLHPGVVILMHDGGGDRSQSVEALRFLLDAVVAAGWKPVLAPHVRLSPAAAARPQ